MGEEVRPEDWLRHVSDDKRKGIRSTGDRNNFVRGSVAADFGSIGGMEDRLIWTCSPLSGGRWHYGHKGASVDQPFAVLYLVVNVDE